MFSRAILITRTLLLIVSMIVLDEISQMSTPYSWIQENVKAVIARGLHLYPFRTEKLNLVASMVLRKRESRTPPPYRRPGQKCLGLFFSLPYPNPPRLGREHFIAERRKKRNFQQLTTIKRTKRKKIND